MRACIFVCNFLIRYCALCVRVRVCIFVCPFLVRCVCIALDARRVKLHVLIALGVLECFYYVVLHGVRIDVRKLSLLPALRARASLHLRL